MSAATDVEPRTYRGATIDELIPQIREELGPEAVILRHLVNQGLDGGVAGFFQKRCVEVVARSGAPGIDAYDEKKPEPSSVSKPASVPKPAFGIDPKPAFGFPARLEPEPEPESPPEPEGAFEPDPAPEPEPAPESEPAHAPEPQPVAPAPPRVVRFEKPVMATGFMCDQMQVFNRSVRHQEAVFVFEVGEADVGDLVVLGGRGERGGHASPDLVSPPAATTH